MRSYPSLDYYGIYSDIYVVAGDTYSYVYAVAGDTVYSTHDFPQHSIGLPISFGLQTSMLKRIGLRGYLGVIPTYNFSEIFIYRIHGRRLNFFNSQMP